MCLYFLIWPIRDHMWYFPLGHHEFWILDFRVRGTQFTYIYVLYFSGFIRDFLSVGLVLFWIKSRQQILFVLRVIKSQLQQFISSDRGQKSTKIICKWMVMVKVCLNFEASKNFISNFHLPCNIILPPAISIQKPGSETNTEAGRKSRKKGTPYPEVWLRFLSSWESRIPAQWATFAVETSNSQYIGFVFPWCIDIVC